jgi:hypothetical protein
MTGEVTTYGKTRIIICEDAQDLGAKAMPMLAPIRGLFSTRGNR